MALIDTILSQIITAKYGREVRQAIHDGIQQCYADAIVGIKGDQGISITSVQRTSGNGAEGTTDVYTVYFSNDTSSTFQVRHGSKGSTGDTGAKGDKGDPGLSIQSIVRTSGTGAEGTVDTYTITLTNGATQNFSIRNGSKGSTGLTGATGHKGDPGVSITNIVRTSGTGEEGTTDIYTIYLSSGASQTFAVKHGSRGPTGATGVGIKDVRKISGTGEEGTIDTYAVMLSNGENKNFDVRHGSKGSTGSKGDPGKGVAGINKVSGTGAPGTTDTYAISYTDGTVTNFNVYNGADGAGSPTAQKLANARALTIGAVSKLFDGSEDVTWSLEELDLAPRLHPHTTSQITDFPTEMPASDVHPWAKAPTKPVYTPIEVGASSEFHEHTTSDITNFPTSMPASDVEAWAKALTKPAYTPEEVGAAPILHNHTTADITSGTLPVERGGTGVTTTKDIALLSYPIGAIYQSTVSTSPAILFGGTWEALEGRMLIGANGTYPAGSTGGEATVALTLEQMPQHRHEVGARSSAGALGGYGAVAMPSNTGTASTINTSYAGSGHSHENLPPYLSVYMWKRTA